MKIAQTNFVDKKGVDLEKQKTSNTPHAQIAQSVEQRIENPRVPGSIPGLGTILNKELIYGACNSGIRYLEEYKPF